MKLLKEIFLIAYCVVLTSCALEPMAPVPTDYYYRLPQPVSIPSKRVFDGDVYVRNFRSNGLHLDRALVFSEDPEGLVLEQHHYHFWQETPPRMLQAQLVSWLRSADAAPLVVTDPSIAHQYVITSNIKRYERHIKASTATVIVVLEMQLQHRGTDTLLLVNDYHAEIEVPDKTVRNSIPAYAEALNMIFTAFLNDADRALHQKQGN